MSKIVLVAKDQAAMKAIDYNTQRPDQVLELRLTHEELEYLLTSGLVDELNHVCEVMIDDYEDEMIKGTEKLRDGLQVLKCHQNPDYQHLTVIDELIRLFQEALVRNTAVYFYL